MRSSFDQCASPSTCGTPEQTSDSPNPTQPSPTTRAHLQQPSPHAQGCNQGPKSYVRTTMGSVYRILPKPLACSQTHPFQQCPHTSPRCRTLTHTPETGLHLAHRSEERRVGKETR